MGIKPVISDNVDPDLQLCYEKGYQIKMDIVELRSQIVQLSKDLLMFVNLVGGDVMDEVILKWVNDDCGLESLLSLPATLRYAPSSGNILTNANNNSMQTKSLLLRD